MSPRHQLGVSAYTMRLQAFATAIEEKYGDRVRLSIHSSTGQAMLPIPLIPQTKTGLLMTPWHSCIAVGVDGSFKSVHAEELRDTFDLILRNGRPHYFREKSDLFRFGEMKVDFDHLYPCGLMIRPAFWNTKQAIFPRY